MAMAAIKMPARMPAQRSLVRCGWAPNVEVAREFAEGCALDAPVDPAPSPPEERSADSDALGLLASWEELGVGSWTSSPGPFRGGLMSAITQKKRFSCLTMFRECNLCAE